MSIGIVTARAIGLAALALALYARMPAPIAHADAQQLYGAACDKCGLRPECPTEDGNHHKCSIDRTYLQCQDQKGNYTCTLNTDTPCGTLGNCDDWTGGSYDPCPAN
ncbi:MAG: hypothetical protein NTU53_03260 [Planctomycetota bacterium]|nr:hypothetical protein [Planctomycetota bacterium]